MSLGFFLDTGEEYKNLFEKNGFTVIFAKLRQLETRLPPLEVFKMFSSGASVGFLNQDYYDVEIDEKYKDDFERIVKDAFARQVNVQKKVKIVFNRLFLVAIR